MANNPSRELILERIRAGLKAAPAAPVAAVASFEQAAPIFRLVEKPLERFQQEAKANLMEVFPAADAAASVQCLSRLVQALPQGEIFVQDAPVLRRMVDAARINRPVRWSFQGGPTEASQATVTLADALIAQTGSIFVTAACGGRGASVVAPVHIVFATTGQIVPDLLTALRNAKQQNKLDQNSFACVISGSSRTADIEKILVQGAHGPTRLVVILQSGG
jgi:L-lactate dehydrogenase complex protein LldG